MACDVSPVAMFLYHDVDTEDDDDFFLLCQDDDDVDEVEEWVEFQFALSGGENDKKKGADANLFEDTSLLSASGPRTPENPPILVCFVSTATPSFPGSLHLLASPSII